MGHTLNNPNRKRRLRNKLLMFLVTILSTSLGLHRSYKQPLQMFGTKTSRFGWLQRPAHKHTKSYLQTMRILTQAEQLLRVRAQEPYESMDSRLGT